MNSSRSEFMHIDSRKRRPQLSSYSHSQGFTLVELAIVMVIIGLMMATVIGFGSSLHTQAQLSNTISREQTIKTALINFVTRNNRLPCPSVATNPSTSANYGVEDTTSVTPASSCPNVIQFIDATNNVTVVTGVVPWISLGLTADSGMDGYNHLFTYQVVQAATSSSLTPQTVSAIKGDIVIYSTVNPTPIPANIINNCPSPQGTNPTLIPYNPCNAVAVIVSHGSDGYGAYLPGGIQAPTTGAGPDELDNAINNAVKNNTFVMGNSSNNPANPYDDIVLPMTANDLISPLTLNGSLQSTNAILASEFKNITASIIANAINLRTTAGNNTSKTFNSTGGYVYCTNGSNLYTLAALGTLLVDPWGAQIQYIPGVYPNICGASVAKNNVTSTANVAFTLQSYGPDGQPGTNDDIITPIPVGQLLGPFNTAGW